MKAQKVPPTQQISVLGKPDAALTFLTSPDLFGGPTGDRTDKLATVASDSLNPPFANISWPAANGSVAFRSPGKGMETDAASGSAFPLVEEASWNARRLPPDLRLDAANDPGSVIWNICVGRSGFN